MKVRAEELKRIRAIEDVTRRCGKLEGEVERYRRLAISLVNQQRELVERFAEIDRGHRRYITRLQVRLQNRAVPRAERP